MINKVLKKVLINYCGVLQLLGSDAANLPM